MIVLLSEFIRMYFHMDKIHKIQENGHKFFIVPYSECEKVPIKGMGTFVKTKIKGKVRYSSSEGSRGKIEGYFFGTIKGKCSFCGKTKKFDFLKYIGKEYSDNECICPECLIMVGNDFIEAYNLL